MPILEEEDEDVDEDALRNSLNDAKKIQALKYGKDSKSKWGVVGGLVANKALGRGSLKPKVKVSEPESENKSEVNDMKSF